MGDLSSNSLLKRYLKNDFRDEIFRLMDLELTFCSFRLASQERISGAETEAREVSPKFVSRNKKNWSRSSVYALMVWEEYLFSNFKYSIKG